MDKLAHLLNVANKLTELNGLLNRLMLDSEDDRDLEHLRERLAMAELYAGSLYRERLLPKRGGE